MADDSVTHKDLAQALGVSETTIKSYRRKFPGCLPVVTRGKPLRFDSKAMEVCRTIQEGFRKGLPVEDLRRRLAEAYAWCAPRRTAAESGEDAPGTAGDKDAVMAELAAAVRELARAQQGVVERLEALESRLESRLDMPAGTGQAGMGGAAPAPHPDKVVRIRTRQGSVERYGLSRMADAPQAEGPEQGGQNNGQTDAGVPAPDAAFLALPMVIRSEGEFLGITGSEGHLSIEGFQELMRRKAGADQPLSVRWERLDEAWVLHLGGPGGDPGNGLAGAHTLHLERTTTPRGNEVVWLKSMLVADDPMPDAYLHRFLRRLRRDFD